MSLRSRSSRESNQRTGSTSVRDRDSGDGLSTQLRSSVLQPRPPVGGVRSSSTSKGAKGARKCPAPPTASVSKRTAAKRLALRTHLPYLRSVPLLLASASGESTSSSPRCVRRSVSSCSMPHETATANRSSYSIIPEALQRVKQLCNGMRDSDRDAPVLMGTGNGSGARERRTSRFTSPSFVGLCEDATAVVQDVEMVQGMLFTSLQSGSTADAMRSLTPKRGSTGVQPPQARSKSWNPPSDRPFLHASSGRFLSKKERRKAWAMFLHKNTHAFSLVVNACRSPLAMREPQVGSALLTFLYNVLRHISGDKQRKAMLLCEKLGIIRVCTLVLQEGKRRLRPGDAVDVAVVASLRACEAAALLFTLGSTFNVKLWTDFRLSQSLESTFFCASVTFRLLEAEFARYHASLQLDLHCATIAETQDYPGRHTRKETLTALQRFQSRTQWTCTAFSHFCFALFAFSGNAATAVDLGARGMELCSTAIAMSTFFLTQIAPLVLRDVAYSVSEQTLHPHVGSLTAVNAEHWVPSWVMRLMRRVEFMLLWCVALMQRLTGVDKVRLTAVEVALRFHVPRSVVLYLLPRSRQTLQVTPRRECVHVILLLLSALLEADRPATLEDMKDLGGLRGVVASVLALSEKSSHQWHHFYLQLCFMYGYRMLPSWNGRPACYVDGRLPASLRGSFDAAKTSGERSKWSEPLSSSVGAVDTRPNVSQTCQSSMQPSLTQWVSGSTESALAPFISSPLRAADAGRRGLNKDLLLVDTRPDVFSPELHSGNIDPMSALAAFDSSQLPWPFTEAAPPTTAEWWYGTSSRVASAAEDAHLNVPLINVSEEDRVRVLRHHIARLVLLDETACDGSPRPHRHKVVFERLSSASPSATGDAPDAIQQSTDGVEFFSDYESGNLQRAVEVSDGEYDLVLSWDTATNSYTQWFSFGMRHFIPGKTYRFNIVNMEKLGSTFNEGQKPLLLHVPDGATPPGPSAPRPQWTRVGEGIFYFGNAFSRPTRAHYFGKNGETASAPAPTPTTVSLQPRILGVASACTSAPQLGGRAPPPVIAKKRVPVPPQSPLPSTTLPSTLPTSAESAALKQKCYFTVTFSVTMPTAVVGTVYLANCFPFTYTELREHLMWLTREVQACPTRSLLPQCLCWTPGRVQVPLLTVTALRRRGTEEPYTVDEIQRRPIALLVARVHPGETNASWVMQGLLDTLLCPPAEAEEYALHLCDNFVFKVIPMLNADGVIMGNHRCSFAGVDLNRDYVDPKAEQNPTVYAMKQLLRYWTGEEKRKVVMFADFHGHSRAKNFLVYGCTVDTMRGIATHSRLKGRGGGGGGRRRRTRDASIAAPAAAEKVIAALLSQLFPSFSLSQSSFAVTKDKKGSARVVLYDEFGVRMSYGFEATMVGGLVCVPELLRANTGTSDDGAATPVSVVHREEVHYNPTVFRAMGDVFLRAFSLLFQQWTALTALAVDSRDNYRKCNPNDVFTSVALQLSWSMTAASGGGSNPPKNPSSPSTREAGATLPRAGPYAAATRGERRAGSPIAAGVSAAPSEAGTVLPAVPVAGQIEALDYLFMADCREGATLVEDGDDNDDEEGNVSGSDISFVDESVDAELEDDDLAAVARVRQRRGRQAETEDAGNASGVSDRSASLSAGSGSDDQDWSGYDSFTGSAAGESGGNRSSVSSVDEQIPTNLFI